MPKHSLVLPLHTGLTTPSISLPQLSIQTGVEISPITASCLCHSHDFPCHIPSRGVLNLNLQKAVRYGNQRTLEDSPRALIRQGRMEEARDVMDMLSTVEDPVERSELTVTSFPAQAEICYNHYHVGTSAHILTCATPGYSRTFPCCRSREL